MGFLKFVAKTLNVNKLNNNENRNETDSLKLEESKILTDPNLGEPPASPENNQPEINKKDEDDE